MSKGLIALLVAIAAIAAVGIYPMIASSRAKKDAAAAVFPAPAQAPRPQPGVAPPGKVWSPEHGHWHDAGAAQGGLSATSTQSPIKIEQSTGPAGPTGSTAPITVSVPKPPGEAPPGKVWSPEHGHWHDAAPAAPAPVTPAPATAT